MSTHSHSPRTTDELVPGTYEEDAIEFGAIIKVGAGLLVVTIVSYIVVWTVYVVLTHRTNAFTAFRQYPLSAEAGERLPPEPRLQTNPKQDLADLRAYEADTLEHYAWVDRNNGVVRIPIERAMALTLERGLPARGAAGATAAAVAPAASPAATGPQEHR